MKTQTYYTRSLPVSCVRLTRENWQSVQTWCHGVPDTAYGKAHALFVKAPEDDGFSQHAAKVGDWIISTGGGFIVMSAKSFKRCFRKGRA